MLNKTVKFLTKNQCYTTQKKIDVKGLMLHSVGCKQPKAEVFIKQFDNPALEKCVHGFIDATGFYQTLPFDIKAWHCGGTGNSTHIGIEMCEPVTHDPCYFGTVYSAAVELFADLCDKYQLDPMKAIVGHYEGHRQGIASNHGDPEGYLKEYGKSMNQFRTDVKNFSRVYRVQVGAYKKKENALAMQERLNALGIKSFIVLG